MAPDIRKTKLCCIVEGRKKPLHLTLCGTCIEKVPFKEVRNSIISPAGSSMKCLVFQPLSFTTNVRSKEVRHLSIHNRTHSPWVLHPVIDGEQWSGPDTFAIEANQYRHYELTYHPMMMTTELNKDHGSIFFPQPDGTGQLYYLIGTAEPPKHVASIVQDIPCKTSHTELLSVENWLRRPQRFTIIIDNIRPERLDRSVSLHGLNYIDVPALEKKEYKLNFYSFKECIVVSRVSKRS